VPGCDWHCPRYQGTLQPYRAASTTLVSFSFALPPLFATKYCCFLRACSWGTKNVMAGHWVRQKKANRCAGDRCNLTLLYVTSGPTTAEIGNIIMSSGGASMSHPSSSDPLQIREEQPAFDGDWLDARLLDLAGKLSPLCIATPTPAPPFLYSRQCSFCTSSPALALSSIVEAHSLVVSHSQFMPNVTG
jgi:hypothetical protein